MIQVNDLKRRGESASRRRFSSFKVGSRGAKRSATGTLALGAAGLIVMALIFVLAITLGFQAYKYGTLTAKLGIVAKEAARFVNKRIWWNGASRQHYQIKYWQGIETAGTQYAKEIATELGLDADSCDITYAPVVTDDIARGILVPIHNYTRDTVTYVTGRDANSSGGLDVANALFGLPNKVKIDGVCSDGSEAPPAFIRFGYKLYDPATSNPFQTNAQQVVILPAYGFQTDLNARANLGGTANNDDVVANQPDSSEACWNGIYQYLDANGEPSLAGTPPMIGDTPLFR